MEMIQMPRIIEPIESRIIIKTFIPFQYPDGTKITKTLVSGNIYEIKYTKNKYSEKTFTGIYIDIDYHIMEKEYEYDKTGRKGLYTKYGDEHELFWKEKGYNPEYYNFFNDGMRWSTCCDFS